MSAVATFWAQRQRPSGGLAAKAVLLELANIHNDNDARLVVRPKISTLAERCMRGERQIQRLLRSLEKDKLIERQPRFSKRSGWQVSNLYILSIKVTVEVRNCGNVGGDTSVTAENLGGDTHVTAQGVTSTSPHLEPDMYKSTTERGSARDASGETRTTAEAVGSPSARRQAGATRIAGSRTTASLENRNSAKATPPRDTLDEIIRHGAYAGMTRREANAKHARKPELTHA